MRLFLKSRHTVTAILFLVAFEASLANWGAKAFNVRHADEFFAVPLAVPAQFIGAVIVLYATGSAHDELERHSSRAIWVPRTINLAVLILSGGLTLALSCVALGAAGTLDAFAPLRAYLGLVGVGLLTSLILDRHLAGIGAAAFAMFPIIFDPSAVPGGSIFGFIVTSPEDPQVWLTPIVLLLCGVLSSVLSPNRRGAKQIPDM
jgi:hypothetical protein